VRSGYNPAFPIDITHTNSSLDDDPWGSAAPNIRRLSSARSLGKSVISTARVIPSEGFREPTLNEPLPIRMEGETGSEESASPFSLSVNGGSQE
jgi:hypothetical protein